MKKLATLSAVTLAGLRRLMASPGVQGVTVVSGVTISPMAKRALKSVSLACLNWRTQVGFWQRVSQGMTAFSTYGMYVFQLRRPWGLRAWGSMVSQSWSLLQASPAMLRANLSRAFCLAAVRVWMDLASWRMSYWWANVATWSLYANDWGSD